MKKIYIVEGIWHVGKSTLINNMRALHDVVIIHEPTHLHTVEPLHDQSAIDAWYFVAHADNLENVCASAQRERRNIFIERSVLSSVAFTNAYDRHAAKQHDLQKHINKFLNTLDHIRSVTGTCARIIYLTPRDLPAIIGYVRGHSYLNKFGDEGSICTYEKYLRELIQNIEADGRAKILLNPTLEM